MARYRLLGSKSARIAVGAVALAIAGAHQASAQILSAGPARPSQNQGDNQNRNGQNIWRSGGATPVSRPSPPAASPLPVGSILPPINWSNPQRMGPGLPGIVPLSPSQMPQSVYQNSGNSWRGGYGNGLAWPDNRRIVGTFGGGAYGGGTADFDRFGQPLFTSNSGRNSNGYGNLQAARPGLPSRSVRPANPNQPGVTDVLHATNPPVSAPSQPNRGEHRRRRGNGGYGNGYGYSGGGITVYTDGPTLLGGYYYGNYCASQYGNNCYPSAFSYYSGFPGYIYNPSVIVLSQPYAPDYTTPYMPFYAPTYQVSYNENNYYVSNDDAVDSIQEGGDSAKRAIKDAFPSTSYQAAFADIERAWNEGNIELIRKHLRDSDTKVAVSLKSKYRYSIASSDLEQITKDAFDRLSTDTFKFSRLRKAKNGDVTAFAKHTYHGQDDASSQTASADGTVPFDTSAPPDAKSDSSEDSAKTVYVSYTLRKRDDMWYIIGVDSSTSPLTSDQNEAES